MLDGDLEKWRDLIARLSLKNLLPRVTLRYADGVGAGVIRGEVVITREVLDRETGALGEVSVAYPLPAFWSEAGAAWYIGKLVAGNLDHEVFEHLCLDDKRCFDPHASQNVSLFAEKQRGDALALAERAKRQS